MKFAVIASIAASAMAGNYTCELPMNDPFNMDQLLGSLYFQTTGDKVMCTASIFMTYPGYRYEIMDGDKELTHFDGSWFGMYIYETKELKDFKASEKDGTELCIAHGGNTQACCTFTATNNSYN